MTPDEATRTLELNQPVECSAEEWPAIRAALVRLTGLWIRRREFVRANAGLVEVRRLDALHGYDALKHPPRITGRRFR